MSKSDGLNESGGESIPKSFSLIEYSLRKQKSKMENTHSFLNTSVCFEHHIVEAKSLEDDTIWGDDKIAAEREFHENNYLLHHAKSLQVPEYSTVIKHLAQLSFETKAQLCIIGKLKPICGSICKIKELHLKHPYKTTDKTIAFDLDDTLIHTYDIKFGNSKSKYPKCIHSITIDHTDMSFAIRPFLYEMLDILKPHFEIIVFTASHKLYADKILDILDPSNKFFDHRLYRNNCVANENCLVKDLRVLKRDLSKVVLVDNSMISFSPQIDNGIPVSSFDGSSIDKELVQLVDYIKSLSCVADVRECNRKSFHLAELVKYCCKLNPV